jgi:hypothetical protein
MIRWRDGRVVVDDDRARAGISTRSWWSSAGISVIFSWLSEVCILLSDGMYYYLHYWLMSARVNWNTSFLTVNVLSVAPLLALYVYRNILWLIGVYTLLLVWILKARVDQLVEFFSDEPSASKYDSPSAFLLLFGATSVVLVSVRFVVKSMGSSND